MTNILNFLDCIYISQLESGHEYFIDSDLRLIFWYIGPGATIGSWDPLHILLFIAMCLRIYMLNIGMPIDYEHTNNKAFEECLIFTFGFINSFIG